MGIRAGDFDILKYLWEQIPKAPDAAHITYVTADIDTLWHLGFVDTAACPLATWQAAFAPFRQPSGTYLLTQPDFLSLDRYRFKGEIYAPFDADLINEGQYTDEGFQELADLSVTPSCSLNRAAMQLKITQLKDRIRQPNGLLKIDALSKREIGHWIAEYPSPMRRLELLFAAMLERKAIEWLESGKPHKASTPQHIAAVQASTFTLLSSSSAADKAQALKSLERAKLPDHLREAPTAEPQGVPLKNLRRNRRGIPS